MGNCADARCTTARWAACVHLTSAIIVHDTCQSLQVGLGLVQTERSHSRNGRPGVRKDAAYYSSAMPFNARSQVRGKVRALDEPALMLEVYKQAVMTGTASIKIDPKNPVGCLKKWRRGQDSNLQDLSVGGFQDRCTTNYATPPHC